MKILSNDGVPALSEREIVNFLKDSKMPLRLATIDERGGYPLINSIGWYYEDGRIYLVTERDSRKARNIGRSKKVYFSLDTDEPPYKGIKGRAVANIIDDATKVVDLAKKMGIKYTGGLDNPLSQSIVRQAKSGLRVVVELNPIFYSTWDYGKR